MSLKHAILGFLSFSPMSGYDLRKAFDNSVRHFWSADQSQIYRTLTMLTAEGLTIQEDTSPDDPLGRKLYHLTEDGRVELHRWLNAPAHPVDDRDPFLIQVFFSSLLTDDEAAAILEQQRAAIAEQLSAYEAMYHGFASTPTDKPRALFFSLLTLESAIVQGRAYLRWLEEALDRVKRDDFQPVTL